MLTPQYQKFSSNFVSFPWCTCSVYDTKFIGKLYCCWWKCRCTRVGQNIL